MPTPKRLQVRFDMPREIYLEEKGLESDDYQLEEPTTLPVDPSAREARFIEPVSIIAAISLVVLAERILHFILTQKGQGVLLDARTTPAHVTVLAGVPQGFVLFIDADGKKHGPMSAEMARSSLGEILEKVLKT